MAAGLDLLGQLEEMRQRAERAEAEVARLRQRKEDVEVVGIILGIADCATAMELGPFAAAVMGAGREHFPDSWDALVAGLRRHGCSPASALKVTDA
jgi:hypothetical protein